MVIFDLFDSGEGDITLNVMYFYFLHLICIITSDPGLNPHEQDTINYNNVLWATMCKSKFSITIILTYQNN